MLNSHMNRRFQYLIIVAIFFSDLARADWCVYITNPATARRLGGYSRCGFQTQQEALMFASGLGVSSQFYYVQENLSAQEMAEREEARRKAAEAHDDDQKGLDAAKHDDWKTATDWFRKASDLLPDDADILAHLKQSIAAQNSSSSEELLALKIRLQNAFTGVSLENINKRLENDTVVRQLKRDAQNISDYTPRPTLGSRVNVAELLPAALLREDPQIGSSIRHLLSTPVPPPILPQEAQIVFGQIAPADERTKNVSLIGDGGITAFSVFAKVGESPVLPWAKGILVLDNILMADVDGAEVFLAKQDETFQKALYYLKDKSTRKDFINIVRDYREGKRLPENASIEMARTAEAMLDPKLGNSNRHIFWDAMWSPEAINSAMTQTCIEVGTFAVEKTAKRLMARILVTHDPEFRNAAEVLKKARVDLPRLKDPASIEALKKSIDLANQAIEDSYRTVKPAAESFGGLEAFVFKPRVEEILEKK